MPEAFRIVNRAGIEGKLQRVLEGFGFATDVLSREDVVSMSRIVSAPSRRNSRITLRVSAGATEAYHLWPSRCCSS